MNAASQVFHIPELLELILLSLPDDTIHTETRSMRTIHTAQTTSRTWHELLFHSTPLRHKLYLPTPLAIPESHAWLEQSAFPPAQPCPWIPQLLLNQRSWGSAWPFESTYSRSLYEGPKPSKPKHWTFSLELSKAQFGRLPKSGEWRSHLATNPPFTDFWYTRSFYELGSGRAPFVTHLDYNAKVPKSEQKYVVHRPGGVTLGDLVDAYTHLFETHPAAKFILIESLRILPIDEVKLEEDRPTTKMYMPGSSAERSLDW
ncbi:hypothetical protein BDY17DRAFT_328259 [Neohortaea acidophila]|uniref:Uncharacterized protein n=1 Tax=Neohortaea acidophila TaxID=245834 RepID=A0A6A6PFH4_9PEZI|nr:uncharacterized protein BDY17DRAFT_328259 [Neohortaea acidophila]KAF2478738.1 hypothetical protein BDY17DRAFT_328259 [Neohortaea acidophila]